MFFLGTLNLQTFFFLPIRTHFLGHYRPTRTSPLQSYNLSSKNSSSRQKPFSDIWGLRLDKYQIHARFILLDTVTDYRSQYQQGAFCISV